MIILPKVITHIRNYEPNLPIHIHCHSSMHLREMLSLGALDTAIVSRASAKEVGQFLHQDKGVWSFNGDIEQLKEKYKKDNKVLLVLF